jgi:hypothetical protein
MFAKALKYLEGLSQPSLVLLLAGVPLLSAIAIILRCGDHVFGDLSLSDRDCRVVPGAPRRLRWSILCSILWLTGDCGDRTHYSSVSFRYGTRDPARRICGVVELTAALRILHYALEARASERAAKLTAEIAVREELGTGAAADQRARTAPRRATTFTMGFASTSPGPHFAGQVLAETLKSQARTGP